MSSPARSFAGRIVVLFRVRSVEVAFTPSWLIMVVALALVFRASVVAPDAGKVAGAATAVGLTLLFYSFVLVHEAAHTIVASVFGLQPRRILLFMLGGVSQIGRDADGPKQEYLVALAGPLASLMIAGLLAAVTRATGQRFDGTWGTLAAVNLALALFNLIPGFPLDGGRVLRATIWALTGDRVRATRIAAVGGRVVAAGLVAGGLVYMLFAAGGVGNAVPGVWYIVLGWFLYAHAGDAGRAEVERELIREQARKAAAPPPAADDEPDGARPVTSAVDIVPEPKRKKKAGSARASASMTRERGTTTLKRAPSGAASAGTARKAPGAKGSGSPKKKAKKPREGDAAKPEANRGRARRPQRPDAPSKAGPQSRDGAGDSRRRSADARGSARRRG